MKPLLLLLAAALVPASLDAQLAVTWGSKGVQTIGYNSVTLEDVGTNPADAFHIWHMKSTDLNGNVLSSGGYGWGESGTGQTWNASTHTETYTFAWGSIAVQFVVSGQNLNMTVTETNNSGSGIIFDGADIYPFALHLPTDPFGGYSQYAITTRDPGVSAADFGSGVVTSVIPDESVWMYGGWVALGGGVYRPLMTTTVPDNTAAFYPRIDHPVQPGTSFSYTVSLRFTPEGTAANAADAYASFAATYPYQLTWNDHRIVGTAYLASSPPCSGCDKTQPGGQANTAYNGSLAGSPTFVSGGKFGNAASGFTDNDYVQIPAGIVQTDQPFTVELWAKTPASSISVALSPQSSSTQLWIGEVPNSYVVNIQGPPIVGAAWHHLAGVYSSGTFSAFVDGQLQGGMFTSSAAAYSAALFLGRYVNGGFAWPGQIDEVAIWKGAKYTANFTPPLAPYTGTEPNLQALYHLDSDASNSAVLPTTNPRRWFNDSSVDITTAAGEKAFQNRVLAQAASTVTTAQNLGAQGVITWDIEGEQYPQDTSYVCSPDQIATVAPEMEHTVLDTTSPFFGQKLDDAYFKVQTNAGLKVGVCLRPNVFTLSNPGTAGSTANQLFLSTNAAIISNLEAKANFAHSRWGVTIFYVDSTVDVNGGTLDPAIWQQISTDLPNFLFIPEESTARYLAYTAPFHSFIFHTDYGTPLTTPNAYNFYPKAFGSVLINDVSSSTLNTYTPQLTNAAAHGDLLMAHSSDYNSNNPAIVSIYQAAHPAVAVVQSAGGSGGATATATLSSPVVGHTLAAIVTGYSSDTLTIPPGWSPRKVGYAPGPGTCPTYAATNLATCVLTHTVAAGDPASYTFAQSGSDGISAILYDLSAANPGLPVNAISYGSAGTGPLASLPVTPSVAGTLAIVCAQPATVTTPTAPAGWVLDQNVTGSNYHSLFCMHRTALTTDTTTPVSASASISPTVAFANSVAFLVAPVPASPNPIAATSGPYFPSATIPWVFDAYAAADPTGEPLAYAWTFGDGATATGISPSHAYAAAGSYTANLTVTNTDGLTGTVAIPVTVQVSPAVVSLGLNGKLNGWDPTPGDALEADIRAWPLDPNSTSLISNFGANTFHADFSSSRYGSAGIPYSVVPANQLRVPWRDRNNAPGSSCPAGLDCSDSDDTLFPFFPTVAIEGNPGNCVDNGGDQHALILTLDGVEYDTWKARNCTTETPRYTADNGTIWDATREEHRGYSQTSADAAGLPMLKPLEKYDEAISGVIRHAFRFTLPRMGCEYHNGCYGTFIYPAVHSAPTGESGNYEGMRIRMHAGYTNPNCTSAINQAFIVQMQTYGGIAADLGGALYVSGTPDERWPDDDIAGCFNSISTSAFDVVVDPTATLYSGARYPTGQYPLINTFTASAGTVASGTPVTLSWDTTYASYNFIDAVGFVRGAAGAVTVNPTVTTTYRLTSTNYFRPVDDGTDDGGRGTASVTVTVSGTPTLALPILRGNAKLTGNAHTP